MVLTAATILNVLTRKNPSLDVKTDKGPNSRMIVGARSTTNLSDQYVIPWTDFNYQHLTSGWGHVLSIEGAKGKFEEELTNSQKEILDEDKIDSVAELWNVECLRDPLKKGAEHIRGTSMPDITIKKKCVKLPRPEKKKALEPDMAIYFKNGNDTSPRTSATILVMGDNKCATKWSHADLTPAGPKPPMGPLWPIRQIVTYCALANTRYGWIMTTSEVVVFRISDNPSSTSKSKHIVEWTYVPWSNHGEGKLTVNLAIWWLGMLSLADKHREIVVPKEVYSIDTWKKAKAKDGTERYVHILSRRTLKAVPTGQPHII